MRGQNRSRKRVEDETSPRSEGKPEAKEKPLWTFAEGQNVSALNVGSKRDECHEAGYLLSHHHLHRLSDDMKLPKFLRLPKSLRRSRSKAKSEIAPIDENQSEADPTTPRPTESTPDLRIGTSTLPTSSPLATRDQESNGMQTILSRTTHLSTPLRVTQTPTPPPIKFYLFPEETKPASRNPQIMPLTQEQHLGAHRIGSRPHMPQPS
jgi:hypothetical protein